MSEKAAKRQRRTAAAAPAEPGRPMTEHEAAQVGPLLQQLDKLDEVAATLQGARTLLVGQLEGMLRMAEPRFGKTLEFHGPSRTFRPITKTPEEK